MPLKEVARFADTCTKERAGGRLWKEKLSTYTKPSRRQKRKPDDFQHGQASGASRGARLGALRDVAATESRDAAGAKFRTVLDGAAIGIVVLDSYDRIIDSNLALREMLGYDTDEIATLTVWTPAEISMSN